MAGGWWEGAVTEVLEGARFQVFFQVVKKTFEFEAEELRLHREWIRGDWVPPPRIIIEEDTKEAQLKEEKEIVDVNNVLTMLPTQLRSYIESYRQKLCEKYEEANRWLSENELLAESLKSEVMEAVMKAVRLNLEQDKEVDVFRLLKIDGKMKGVDLWLLKNGIPRSKESDVKVLKEAVRLELNRDEDTDMENFLSIFETTVEWIQEFLPFNRLKKVKLLEMLDEKVLKEICKHLKPLQYEASSYIIQEGQPLELILFVEGTGV